MSTDKTTSSPRKKALGYSRAMRLVRTGDFDRAFRAGSRARAGVLLVVVNENSLGHSRLGLSIGKRIWRKAHRRNRLRRLFREAFRLEYDALPQGLDMILIPAAVGLETSLQDLRKELVSLSHKAHKRLLEKRANEKPAEPQA
ncbi:MAG: ribonuclease P protein component [Planctomycetota bacterium]|jgi:ribonuclease P protein component